jgi:hypothetical protein
MPPQSPKLSDAIVFSDDAKLAAQVSCSLAVPGVYLPVVDGPRMQRPDREAEVIDRTNAAARARARRIFLAGLADESADALSQMLGRHRPRRISSSDDLEAIATDRNKKNAPFVWGNDRVGIGLLLALRRQRQISFEDRPSERVNISPKSDHLVVCEEGDEFAQVIAANYAFALGAGLFLIQATLEERVNEIMERFYSVLDNRDQSPSEALRELRQELRNIAGDIPIPLSGSITFITDGLPYGFAFPEVPSTHLFSYPNLGIATLHGFAAEQPGSRGVQVATLVNPETTPAPENRRRSKYTFGTTLVCSGLSRLRRGCNVGI